MLKIAIVTGLLTAVALTVFALVVVRLRDWLSDARLWAKLSSASAKPQTDFQLAMLEGLPEPARRFFRAVFTEGEPMYTTAVIKMGGHLDLGGKDRPKPQPMRAEQVLAPPHGFLWKVSLPGAVAVSGSDAFAGPVSWSRFRLFNILPVARAGRTADHRLSAYGRMVGEAVFWTPAALLPAAEAGWDRLEWETVCDDVVAVTASYDGLETRVELTVDADGRPLRVVFDRWSNENPEKRFAMQPFGGDFTEWRAFEGCLLPTAVHAGNHYGTALYHPFYDAKVTAISFPQSRRIASGSV